MTDQTTLDADVRPDSARTPPGTQPEPETATFRMEIPGFPFEVPQPTDCCPDYRVRIEAEPIDADAGIYDYFVYYTHRLTCPVWQFI